MLNYLILSFLIASPAFSLKKHSQGLQGKINSASLIIKGNLIDFKCELKTDEKHLMVYTRKFKINKILYKMHSKWKIKNDDTVITRQDVLRVGGRSECPEQFFFKSDSIYFLSGHELNALRFVDSHGVSKTQEIIDATKKLGQL